MTVRPRLSPSPTRISVITPVFHAGDRLVEAVRSVQSQVKGPGVEIEHIIIADDQQDYGVFAGRRNDVEVRVLSTGVLGAGPSVARNVGLRASQGDIVGFLDADDKWLPGRLLRLLPEVWARGAAVDRIRLVHPEAPSEPRPLIPRSGYWSAEDALTLDGAFFPLYHRDVIVHGWEEALRFSEDTVFNLRALLASGGMTVIDAELLEYRVWSTSLTHRMPHAAIEADRAYETMQKTLSDASSWAWLKEPLRGCFLARIREKQAINREYAAAWFEAPLLTFEQFMARRAQGTL